MTRGITLLLSFDSARVHAQYNPIALTVAKPIPVKIEVLLAAPSAAAAVEEPGKSLTLNSDSLKEKNYLSQQKFLVINL